MYSTLDNAVWDHFRIKTGGRSTILDAGGAEDGMIFRVNAGQNGDVGTVTYNTVLTLKNDLTATFAGAVSGSSFTSTSDMRLKENITPISNELLANLTKLNAYSYRYRREANGPTYYGVIAQEVASLFPHAVRTNVEGLMSVDYGALGAIAASAVGRVQVKVDQLQAEQQKAVVRLDKLESGLNTATLKIESLETWRIASTQKLDDIQKSLDSSMATIAKHALRLDEGEKKLVKLEEVVKDLDLKTQGQEKRLAQVEGQVKDSLSYNADSRTLQVKADFLVASNFSAQQVAAKAVMTERLEA